MFALSWRSGPSGPRKSLGFEEDFRPNGSRICQPMGDTSRASQDVASTGGGEREERRKLECPTLATSN